MLIFCLTYGMRPTYKGKLLVGAAVAVIVVLVIFPVVPLSLAPVTVLVVALLNAQRRFFQLEDGRFEYFESEIATVPIGQVSCSCMHRCC